MYGCETWLITSEVQFKIQTNGCLRYILRIWWPKIISNKNLWKAMSQEDMNLEISSLFQSILLTRLGRFHKELI
jgi:hypothetical protein